MKMTKNVIFGPGPLGTLSDYPTLDGYRVKGVGAKSGFWPFLGRFGP